MAAAMDEPDVAILRTRNAMKCWCNSNYCRWTKSSSGLVEVLYHKTITSVNDPEKAMIETSMKSFHTRTCIRFGLWSGQSDYIDIQSKKQDTNNPNTPYDNSSVVHGTLFKRPAFSIENGKDTITPIPSPSVKIGC
ncbi:high choriolytic enzyme 2-like [Salvelinus fontinalis]|uniref:high choriolytic enzyme 2-like n=1 Tax=Salvelinus fontinalis TaxID=8038 RepID=UPI002484EE44|nr:high choriolytic enzyme 2-like [Salvelinus fontinalis]